MGETPSLTGGGSLRAPRSQARGREGLRRDTPWAGCPSGFLSSGDVTLLMVGHVRVACKRQASLCGTSSYIAPIYAPQRVFFWKRLKTEGFPQRVPTPLTLPQGTSGKVSHLGHRHGCKRERAGLAVAHPCSRLGGCQRATGAVVVGEPGTALPSWTPVPERPVSFGKRLPFCWGHLRGRAEMFLMLRLLVAVLGWSGLLGCLLRTSTHCQQEGSLLLGPGMNPRHQAFHLYVREGKERPRSPQGDCTKQATPQCIQHHPAAPRPPTSPWSPPAAFPSWDIQLRDVSLRISLGKQGFICSVATQAPSTATRGPGTRRRSGNSSCLSWLVRPGSRRLAAASPAFGELVECFFPS